MASSSKQQPEEFVVRVPKLSKTKKIEILKFNANLNVDVTQWSNVNLVREDNSSVFVNPTDQPKDGVGSEFGKQTRDEARRKKMGYEARRYKKDDQPWLININTVTPTSKTTKKYRGIREGGVTQNADFWVFVKSGDGVFDALPVDEWYSFMPIARYKTLDAEEAEEQFSKRNKVLNQFALKMKLKLGGEAQDDPEEEEGAAGKKKTKAAKAGNDDDEMDGDKKKKSNDSDDDDVAPTKAVRLAKSKKKKTALKKAQKKRRKSDAEGDDLIASAESDDGDDEGREVDYMSDSELSMSSDDEPEDTKVRQALRGVDEEDGMRKLMASEDEEEEEQNEDEKDDKKKFDVKSESMPTGSAFGGPEENDSDSGSDSDDPDKEDIKSALFLQEKKSTLTEENANAKPSSAANGSSSGPSSTSSNGQKRKNPDDPSSVPTKKSKSDRGSSKSSHGNASGSGGITEEEVRRYLQRKPLSTTELVAKFKPRCQGMGKQEIVQCLADILKRLKPEQFRHKDTLYFSLKNS